MVWEIITRAGLVRPLILLAPFEIIKEGFRQIHEGILIADASVSIYRIVMGWFFATVLAMPIGILMGNFKFFEGLFEWLTVEDNIRFALKKSDFAAGQKNRAEQHYIDIVGLKGFEKAYPKQLSGGICQRVAMAWALVYHPGVLLMDEPIAALDAQTRGMMQELLLIVWEKHRITVVFITHDVEEAIFFSDRVIVMSARPGRLESQVAVPIPQPRSYEFMTGLTQRHRNSGG